MVGAIDDDDVLVAPGNREPAAIEPSQVTGTEPAIGGENVLAPVLAAEVAVEYRLAAHLQLADLPLVEQAIAFADDTQADARNGRADADGRVVVGGRGEAEAFVVGDPGAGLGHAPGGHHHVAGQTVRRQ